MRTENPADVTEVLRVELEEVGQRHWWAAMLATLSSQSGSAYMRFVGVVDGAPRYVGDSFPVPRTWGTIPPQESWAPGMSDSLAGLRSQLAHDGWSVVQRGEHPWSFTYQRVV